MRDHNRKFTLTEVERLVYEGISSVTPVRWQKIIDHVKKKVEDHYWEHDGLYETMVEGFVIHVGDSSEDSTSSSECSSSEED